MSGVQIHFDASELARLSPLVADMIRRGDDTRPMMEAIGAVNENAARERIESTNVSPSGQAWKPSLRVRENGGKTLMLKHHLADSLTSEATATEVATGSNLPYARIHQLGGTIVPKTQKALKFRLPSGGFVTVKKVTIPQREYLGPSADDLAAWADIVEDHFLAGLPGLA